MKNTWLIVVLIVVIAVLAGLVGYLIASTKRSSVLQGSPNTIGQQKSQSGQIAQDPSGPQNDKVYFTSTSDPKIWPVGTLVEKGSVPDLIELEHDIGQFKKGDLLVYFVDFTTVQTPGSETLSMVASSDLGKTWSKKSSVTVANKPNKGAPVDPSLVQLADGTLRLYFFGSEVTQGDPAAAEGSHKVYSATSKDGVSFATETGERFAAEDLTDPEIISYKDQWYMYYSLGQKTGLAISSDGLQFSEQAITGGEVGGVPGAVTIDGGVRLYGCGPGGLGSAISTDGISFKKDTEDVLGKKVKGVVCDPAAVQLPDGGYGMVYKIIEH